MSDSLRGQLIKLLHPFIDRRYRTTDALDAALDFLSDNAEAWTEAAKCGSWRGTVRELIAVLRDTPRGQAESERSDIIDAYKTDEPCEP